MTPQADPPLPSTSISYGCISQLLHFDPAPYILSGKTVEAGPTAVEAWNLEHTWDTLKNLRVLASDWVHSGWLWPFGK